MAKIPNIDGFGKYASKGRVLYVSNEDIPDKPKGTRKVIFDYGKSITIGLHDNFIVNKWKFYEANKI